MRLFVALNFNAETRSRLLALRNELRSRSERGNFSLSENLHLTLAFLGECGEQQATAVKAAMDTIKAAPFDIEIDHIGRFRRDGGDIWWAGIAENKPLLALQKSLADKLKNAGFSLERRKYMPHITLGREIVTTAAPWPVTPFGEHVWKMDLMKSERIQGKLTYTVIHSSELTKE